MLKLAVFSVKSTPADHYMKKHIITDNNENETLKEEKKDSCRQIQLGDGIGISNIISSSKSTLRGKITLGKKERNEKFNCKNSQFLKDKIMKQIGLAELC